MSKRQSQRPFQLTALTASGVIALAALFAASACGSSDEGSLHGKGGDSPGGDEPTPTDPSLVFAPAHVRRLTTQEVRNSIRDLFGVDDSTFNWSTFPVEGLAGKEFDNASGSLSAPVAFTEPMDSAAEWAGQAVATKLKTLLPCAAGAADDACAGTFVDQYAPRAYRRPLLADERAGLLDVFAATRKASDFPTSIATIVEAMLLSPSFLFRTELGDRVAGAAALTPYETAAALSYFLWSSIPDQALTDAAAGGHLSSASDLDTQTKRMLADPRAGAAAGRMFQQWLSSGGTLGKEDPAFNAAMNTSMMAELDTFVDKTVWGGPHGFQDLFTSASSFVDGNMAALYGIPAPQGTGLVPTSLDPAKHAGFLTMPGFIGTFTGPSYRAPIGLGHFVRSRVFCQDLMPPPDNVPQPPSDPNLDEHQRFEAHSKNASCAGCHNMMDPIGYGWSQYDVLGRFSPVDHGVTEDGVGTLTATDVDGKFAGPVELGKKLAASAKVQQCFSGHVLAWALGRKASGELTSSDAQAMKAAAASGYVAGDVKSLFATLSATDSFRFRDTSAVPKGGN